MKILLPVIFLFLSLQAFSQQAATEILSERSMYAKIYDLGEEKRQAIICGGPLHYLQNNQWVNIQTDITHSANGDFQNLSNALKSYYPAQIDANNSVVFNLSDGANINIKAQKKLVTYQNATGLSISNSPNNQSVGTAINNKLSYQNIFPNIDEQYIIENGYIKNELILLTAPTQITTLSSGYFGYKEWISLPAGWTIASHGGISNGLTTDPLYIKDAMGEMRLIIPAPIFFDNNGASEDGLSAVQGQYFLETNGQEIGLSTLVPINWLKDPARNYPVTLDPVTTLAGTNGGWQSPNNFVNNGSFVFVGVCCGNQTHRSWIHFNTTSIPDNACVNAVELQYNCNGVGGAGAETVFLNDVKAVGPGPYPSINAAAYQDFGDGTYTDFIATGTGNYGFFNLGAQAALDLQGKLNVNWFEVGSHFLNEPSTNWKRFVASASSLRVDYEVPPSCVLLSIQLNNFKADCQNNLVELSWSTTTEVNSNEFIIEKSENGVEFSRLATVAAAGNSNSLIEYNYTDENPAAGNSYYRIRYQGQNGTIAYSTVEVTTCAPKEESVQIYPNPVNNTLHIDFVSKNKGRVDIAITDVSGKIVHKSNHYVKVGFNRFEIELNKLPAAMYQLMIKTEQLQIMRKISKL